MSGKCEGGRKSHLFAPSSLWQSVKTSLWINRGCKGLWLSFGAAACSKRDELRSGLLKILSGQVLSTSEDGLLTASLDTCSSIWVSALQSLSSDWSWTKELLKMCSVINVWVCSPYCVGERDVGAQELILLGAETAVEKWEQLTLQMCVVSLHQQHCSGVRFCKGGQLCLDVLLEHDKAWQCAWGVYVRVFYLLFLARLCYLPPFRTRLCLLKLTLQQNQHPLFSAVMLLCISWAVESGDKAVWVLSAVWDGWVPSVLLP